MSNIPEFTNLISMPCFQKGLNNYEINRQDLVKKIELISRDPTIYKLLDSTYRYIENSFPEQVVELTECDDNENCEVIPLKQDYNQSLTITTDNEYYLDFLRDLETYTRYREQKIKEHLAIKRVVNKA